VRLPKNVRRRGGKLQACPRINGRQHVKTFPASATLEEVTTWIRQQQVAHSTTRPSDDGTSFAGDIEIYLAKRHVIEMPTSRQRRDHLWLWRDALTQLIRHDGQFRRQDVTKDHLNEIIGAWLGTLSPSTVRKRCMSLQAFYKDMNGEDGPNPLWVARVPTAPPLPDDPGALDYADIERALAVMPEYQSTAPGAPRAISVAKVVARLMAYVGLPPKVIDALEPHDLCLRPMGEKFPHGWVRVRGREKGTGVGPRKLPLSKEGVAAFVDFHTHDCYHRVPVNVGRCFVRAWGRAGLPREPMVFYRLRHSFLTRTYEVVHDEATVARLGLHAPGSPITARYTRAAHATVNAAAICAFSESLAAERAAMAKPPRVVAEARKGVSGPRPVQHPVHKGVRKGVKNS
jgi:integrase